MILNVFGLICQVALRNVFALSPILLDYMLRTHSHKQSNRQIWVLNRLSIGLLYPCRQCPVFKIRLSISLFQWKFHFLPLFGNILLVTRIVFVVNDNDSISPERLRLCRGKNSFPWVPCQCVHVERRMVLALDVVNGIPFVHCFHDHIQWPDKKLWALRVWKWYFQILFFLWFSSIHGEYRIYNFHNLSSTWTVSLRCGPW